MFDFSKMPSACSDKVNNAIALDCDSECISGCNVVLPAVLGFLQVPKVKTLGPFVDGG